MKDGRTGLAFQVENAVDMETGAIVAEVAGEDAPEGNAAGVQEVVADRGYHSNEVVRGMEQLQVRGYNAEPERGVRNWEGKLAEKAAAYANRRRVQGWRGKRLQSQRGERIKRNFAHQFDTGGMDRSRVRGKGKVRQKVLIQARHAIWRY